MATYKIHKTKDYTVMSNTHLRDKNLSFKAKGLLSVMLSLPEEWDYSMNGLVAISKENLTAVRSTLTELEEHKYLIRERKQNEKGQFEYEYHIYEIPHSESTTLEKPYTENLHAVNVTQLNTNELITKELSTNKLSTKEEYIAVIAYLNEKAGTKFRAKSKDTQKHINARLEEGYTLEDFKTVIDKKCAEWLGTEMAQYLRPVTLFGTKFESYLNAPVVSRKTYGGSAPIIQVINGKEYECRNGRFYIPNGSGVEVNPYAADDLPF